MGFVNSLDFYKFFNRPELNLPIKLGDKDYYATLEALFKNYLDGMRQEPFEHLHTEECDANSIDITGKQKDIQKVCKNILHAVELYLNGYPNKAYAKICKVMTLLTADNRTLAVYTKNAIRAIEPKNGTKLYRVRAVKENKKFHKKEIFHVPFALRAYVNSNRYSIAGFPSLYLSSTLDLCYAEAELSEFNDFQIAAEFQFVRNYNDTCIPIRVLELAIKPQDFFTTHIREQYLCGFGDSDLKDEKIWEQNLRVFWDSDLQDEKIRKNYLFWYPLIAACSFIRKNRKAPFSVEYIVPQLLMQWLRSANNKDTLYGIRYFSCKTERLSDMGFNYVFPVSGADCPDMIGYCSQLRKCFRLTEPINMCDYKDISTASQKLSIMPKNNL